MMNVDQTTKLWHYTTGTKLPLIQEDGLIRTSPNTSSVNEREAVWFSKNPVWEKTAAKGWFDPRTGEGGTLTMEEHVKFCDGLFRIGVAPETAPHNWNEFRTKSRILPKHANGLRSVAYSLGARISDWFVSFEDVPRSK